ncbi:MAG: prepilin-type N-terminal cleavage/methylation domain-containing protein [Dehalococcoidales bacterium]|nr:prepilin-type N-terminal cleavage/methylation domain-containing protein [Dehalococcoidales bacterium]
MPKLNAKRGFTLIELLIVITIIAILVGAGTVSWTNAQIKGRDSRRKVDLKAVQQALELYYQTNGTYPGHFVGQISCINEPGHTINWNGGEFYCTPPGGTKVVYMKQLPLDPLGTNADTTGYYYLPVYDREFGPVASNYVLSAKLENTKDPDKTNLPCTPQSGRNYCVINP